MRGRVLASASVSEAGLIAGDDGQRYRFAGSDTRNGLPRPGQEVDFEIAGGNAAGIYIVAAPTVVDPAVSRGWLSFYFNPTGRVSRRQYWLYGVLVTFVASLLLGWVPVVGQIIGLATFWSSIALSCKRCHDVGRSGWWSFVPPLPLAAAVVTAIIEATIDSSGTGTVILGLVTVGCYLWLLTAIYIRRGDPGPNRFGPDPIGVPIA